VMNAVEQPPLLLASLSKLTKHRDLGRFLTAALREAIQASNCQGASLLLVGEQVSRLREGELSPEIEDRISRWEDSLQQRLRTASWHIREGETLPITTDTMKDTRHLLVNTPLLHGEQVTGSLTTVFAPGHSLSLSQRQVLTSCAGNIGNLAKIIEQLTTTQNSLKQLSFLYETSQALISTLDLREVLNNTMELATKILNASASTLMLLKEDTKELVFEIAHGQKREVLRRYHTGMDSGIAGWVATHGEPAMVNDVSRDERFSRDIDARTGFLTESVVCVPLQIRKRTIGVLEVLNKISGEGFTENDLRLLSTLAAQAAIAIENARLYRNLREERDKIIRAQEEARRELARDLHDSTVQSVSSLAMRIDYIRRLLESEPEKAIAELEQLQAKANQASAEARTLLFKLRPVVLETQGLVRALEAYVDHLQGESPPIFHFNDGGFHTRLSEEVEATAFIIVQEAISNARKHANAENIWLNLGHDEKRLFIAVEDDGSGFDPDAVRETYDESNHLGLLSMQERAQLIDGQLNIQSKPGQGTKVVLGVALTSPTDQSQEPAAKSSAGHSSRVS
jgi:signal transduction histidine kinase